jgi:all-trans-retinol 13,14-reductase
MKYDVIIIGGGLGGLTAGSKLAKEGKKVMLVKQHNIPGGCATTFKRRGYAMDVGLHETDGLDETDTKTKIFNDLKVFDNVEFLRVPEFYRFVNGRVDIAVSDDYRKAEKEFIEKFPAEESGIRKFMRVITGIKKEVNKMPREIWKTLMQIPIFPFLYPNIVRYNNKSIGEFVDSIVKNEDLKLALIANVGYYHDNPYTLSMLYFGVAQGGFYLGGGHYIKGGSQKLSDYLAGFIKESGGEVVLGHLVTKILIENKKAVGIEYKKTLGEKETKKAYADVIIANAAVPNVATGLLPTAEAEVLKKAIMGMEVACSLLSIYLFFKKPAKEYGCKHYSNFIFSSKIKSMKDLNYDMDYKERGFVFVDYSQIDSQLSPEGKAVGAICTVDYLKNWENLSDDEYKAKKEVAARDFIERLNELFPGIKEGIDFYEVGTPKTIRRYTLNPLGTPYGFAQIHSQSGMKRMKRKSPIKNLYFASAWTMPGGGFTGAILGGYFCAEEILRK